MTALDWIRYGLIALLLILVGIGFYFKRQPDPPKWGSPIARAWFICAFCTLIALVVVLSIRLFGELATVAREFWEYLLG